MLVLQQILLDENLKLLRVRMGVDLDISNLNYVI